MWRLWMSQSCFSLGFLFQYSLWKLSTFRGYKGYLCWGENGMWRVRFFKTELAGSLDLRLDWVASSSCKVTERPVYTFCPEVLRLLWRFNFWHAWHVCNFLAACKLRATGEIQSRVPASLHNLEHFFTFSHTLPLHDSHLNTRLLIAKIQANLAWNKSNKMVDRIQPYTYYCFRIKILAWNHALLYYFQLIM